MCAFWKKNKPAEIRVIDTVWLNETAKWRAAEQKMKEQPSILLVCWFDETIARVQQAFSAFAPELADRVLSARQLNAGQQGVNVIFAEHHPLKEKERVCFDRLPQPVEVWSSLDEPLFMAFGGERIAELMQKLGMKESEPVSHTMVSRSIEKAQEKISKKLVVEHAAASQEEWLRKNLAK